MSAILKMRNKKPTSRLHMLRCPREPGARRQRHIEQQHLPQEFLQEVGEGLLQEGEEGQVQKGAVGRIPTNRV